MIPVYDISGITLYAVDTLAALSIEAPDPIPRLAEVQIVLTDPPYASHRYLRTLAETGHLDMREDAAWCADIFFWVGHWLRPLRLTLPADAAGWIFCNVHYVGFYLRWAHLLHWPLRGVFGFGTGEFLLAFGSTPITAAESSLLDLVLQENRYGQGKSVPMLRALLQASPPGLVFDPFAGSGSALLAARQEGREAMGLELDHEAIQRTIRALYTSEDPCPSSV